MSGRSRRKVPILYAGVLFAALGLGTVAPSQAQAADGTLTVAKGTVRATTLTGNLTGKEAVLKGNSSTASQKISGTGSLVLMARGTSCKGNAKVRVYVNNKKVKDISLSAAKKFTKYTVKNYTAAATRTVKVRLINNKAITHKCNRDAFVAGSYMSGAAPANSAASTTAGKPSAATTGVKAGARLTRHDGDITVTKDGTVLANLDVHGFVIVRAENVTITNSIVRGGKAKGFATGLITDYGYKGLLISDTRIVPEFPSVWFDGIKGSGFTARRVHISGGVDSVKIQGNNTVVEDSLLEDTDYYANDPQQGGTPTHNDNIQIQNGQNVKVTGNTIRGATNFAVLGAASKGNLNLIVKDNWLDGGHCTVKLQILNGWAETATVTGNKFGPNRAVSSCAFTSYPAVKLTQNSNTFENGGTAVKPVIVVS
ncbi:MAG TPA: carbohydrate-binding domain-containing protein [Propionicimonas sp.]